jgi:hypothetical protein
MQARGALGLRRPPRLLCRDWIGTLSRLVPSCVSACVVVIGLVGWCGGTPATASAFATVEGPPRFSSASGLPDGRVYEQVSPADKNGNEAGAGTSAYFTGTRDHYGYSSPDGDAVLFEGTGPMGESPWADSIWFVATRNVGVSGWSTRALLPKDLGKLEKENLLNTSPNNHAIVPSQDLSHALDRVGAPLGPVINEGCSQMFLTGSDPFVPGTWVERPSRELVSPVESCGREATEGAPVGGTPDFSTVYFTVPGTLLPQDASRAAHAATENHEVGEAWGLYEYAEGVLHEAGVLPDGSLSPFGAVPAASGDGKNPAGNQVSDDGSRLFFVSPDPASCKEGGGHDECATEPPELYVHEIGHERAQLISRDTLLGEPAGAPVAAPGGILKMPNNSRQLGAVSPFSGSFVFASPDGSEAFFQSTEALTRAAAKDSPGAEPKTYDFDVETGSLTFLPGVQGEILAVDSDGAETEMAFMTPEGGGQPAQLNLWSAGLGGGTVTPVVQLPEAGASVPETRISADGSSLVFQTADRLSSSFNSGGWEQIYRYDVPANTLGCVSCDPAGVTPRGNAEMSTLLTDEERREPVGYESAPVPIDQRGISSDGERIFFASPDPLVPQDINTNSPEVLVAENETRPQGLDVYEWENGAVYLISTGQSPRDSYLLDSSENGNDIFFATAQSLVSGDTDGGYDVYDARVPQPGETTAAVAQSPCERATCQGAANTGPSAPPQSASFSGAGNLVPEVTPPPVVSSPPKALKCKKGYVKSKNKCVKVKPKKKAKKTSSTTHGRRAS